MSNTLQSVDRALRILLFFEIEGQEIGIGELADRLSVHKSTASRLVATLRRHELLERVPDSERYRLGPQLGRLAMLALRGGALVESAREPMAELAAATGETVTLAVRHGHEVTTVAQLDARFVVGVRNWVGMRTPIHCTSDGKIFLAFDDVDPPEGPLQALTEKTVTDRAALRRHVDDARKRGWATAVGELEEGLNGVAVPVLDAAGCCRAALSVSAPAYRLPPEKMPQLAARCDEAAAAIGLRLLSPTDGRRARAGGPDGAPTPTGPAATGVVERVG